MGRGCGERVRRKSSRVLYGLLLNGPQLVGGASPLQEVQTGPQGCYEGNSNTSLKVFSFNVSGSTAECDNLRLSWQNPAINGPYWLNVIPLDGTYTPWGIQMSTTNNYYDFQVNMSAGTYFTVMLR
jgi:hypothetical protein